ncbi:MAG: BamA/TamA family outer membrane protein, partial [Myxococcota bacterium]
FGYLEQQFTWQVLNDPLRRERGFEFKLLLQQAIGTYAFLKFAPELNVYFPLFQFNKRPVVLAARLSYGVLFSTRLEQRTLSPTGDAEADRVARTIDRSPITQRFFLGGANTVRGWTERYLGPLACQIRQLSQVPTYGRQSQNGNSRFTRFQVQRSQVRVVPGAGQLNAGRRCNTAVGQTASTRFADQAKTRQQLPQNGRRGLLLNPPSDAIIQVVPIGGEQQFQASLELRIPLFSSLGMVLFSDLGVVQLERSFWDNNTGVPPDLLPSLSLGAGLRLYTMVGAIRADFAFRIAPDALRYPLQRTWQLHLSIGEAF